MKRITANAGVFHVGWQLSRRGWSVHPGRSDARSTILAARAPDGSGQTVEVQSRALSKKAAVSLGASLDTPRAPWWAIAVGVHLDAPECFIPSWEEVRARASRDKGGDRLYWLEPRDFMLPEFRDAWDRIRAQ